MISALGSISKQEKVVMSVGPKEVGLYNKGEKVIERKSTAARKMDKGADHGTDLPVCCRTDVFVQSHIRLSQLFQTLPKGTVKCDYYLVMRGQKPAFHR